MPSGAVAHKPAPIGVFDSGVGGLSVLREIHRAIPFHPTIYYADQAHLPYGTKSNAELFAYVDAITRWLIGSGAQVIVLACNTASAACLRELRTAYPDVSFVGMEPAIKPAVEATQTGVIGVLATHVTAQGELYRATMAKVARAVQVITQPAPEWVMLVERGDWHSPEARDKLAQHLAPILSAHADQVALACTHFPFLRDALEELAGGGVTFIDPAPAVARQTRRMLQERGLLIMEGRQPHHRYITSGDAVHLKAMLARLIDVQAEVTELRLAD